MTRGHPRGSKFAERDAEIERRYIEEGQTLKEIAKDFALTRARVHQLLKRRGADDPDAAKKVRRERKGHAAAVRVQEFDDESGRLVRRLLMGDVPAPEIAQRLTLLGRAMSDDDVRSFARRHHLAVPKPVAPKFSATALRLAVLASAAEVGGLDSDDTDAALLDSEELASLADVSGDVSEVVALAGLAAVGKSRNDLLTVTKNDYEAWRGRWLGRFPKADSTPWPPTAQTVMKRLGRGYWNDAVRNAGLSANTRGRPRGALVYTAEDEHLRAIADFLESAASEGLPLSMDEYERWSATRPVPSGSQVRNHFGGWNAAKMAAAEATGAKAARSRVLRALPADQLVDRFLTQARNRIGAAADEIPTQASRAMRDLKTRDVAVDLVGDLVSDFESFRRRWILAAIKEDPSAFVARLGPDGDATRAEKREWLAIAPADARDAIEDVVTGQSLDKLISEGAGDLRAHGGWLATDQAARLMRIDAADTFRWRVFKASRNVIEHDLSDAADRLERAFEAVRGLDAALAVGRAPSGPASVKRWLVADGGGALDADDGQLHNARVGRLYDLVVRVARAMRSTAALEPMQTSAEPQLQPS